MDPEVPRPPPETQLAPGYRIEPLTAEFADATVEQAYRGYALEDATRHVRISLSVGAAFFLAFSLVDFLGMGWGTHFLILLAGRLICSGTALGIAHAAPRRPGLVTGGEAITALEIAVSSVFILACVWQPNALPWHGMGLLMLSLAYYLFVPNRLVPTLLSVAYLSAAFATAVALFFQPTSFEWSNLTLYLALTNVFGYFAARRFHVSRRQEFARYRAERLANERLTDEIAMRRIAEAALKTSEASLAEAQRIARLGTWAWNPDSGETYWSDEMYRMLGLAPGAATPDFPAFMAAVHPHDAGRVRTAVDQAVHDGQKFDLEFRLIQADGTECVIHSMGEAVRDESGRIVRVLGTGRDITERKRAEERLSLLANYDPLTGLPNRNLFHEHLRHALAQAHRERQGVALLFLDLDNFKVINDTLGHATGDELLRQVAARLKSSVREGDIVARLGGDEFTIILERLSDREDAAAIALLITHNLSRPFALDGNEIFSGASVGITLYPEDGSDVGSLLINADTAMYCAKERGSSHQFFTPEMGARAAERLNLERDLRHALEWGEFRLHYQPQLDLGSGRIVGMEALLRWQHPARGLTLPAEFIPVAEETGLIVPIGEWVLKTAALQCRAWQDKGFGPLQVAVNISVRQFHHDSLAESIARILDETGLDASSLILEITESFLIGDSEGHAELLRDLRQMGLHLSIDDFGTGYSSLAYLKRFPIDSLKVDKSFVMGIPGNADDMSIGRAIVAMARGLGLKVIAEGVETTEQLCFYRNEGCQAVQGFLVSEALPANEFEELMQKNKGCAFG